MFTQNYNFSPVVFFWFCGGGGGGVGQADLPLKLWGSPVLLMIIYDALIVGCANILACCKF